MEFEDPAETASLFEAVPVEAVGGCSGVSASRVRRWRSGSVSGMQVTSLNVLGGNDRPFASCVGTLFGAQ
jgi:hypothetical protein